MERAFIVRGGGIRLKSWHYRFNFLLMACWLTVFILLETGRIYALRGDGVCIFGWQWWALIPLMSLDVFVNCTLSSSFQLCQILTLPSLSPRYVRRSPLQEPVHKSQAPHARRQVYVDLCWLRHRHHLQPGDVDHDRRPRLALPIILRRRYLRQCDASLLRMSPSVLLPILLPLTLSR